MKEIIDSITMADFNKGSEIAFKKVYHHFYPQLRHFALSLTNDPEEAKDIASDALLKLYQRYQLFDNLANVRAFLYVSVRNKCFDYLKMTRRLTERHKEFAERMREDAGLESEQVRGEVLHTIFTAVENLPAECKKIFKMAFYQGMSHAEIAGQLAVTEATVRSQKRRALQLLREVLSDHHLVIACMLHIMHYDLSELTRSFTEAL